MSALAWAAKLGSSAAALEISAGTWLDLALPFFFTRDGGFDLNYRWWELKLVASRPLLDTFDGTEQCYKSFVQVSLNIIRVLLRNNALYARSVAYLYS